jgi:hypothetical protein
MTTGLCRSDMRLVPPAPVHASSSDPDRVGISDSQKGRALKSPRILLGAAAILSLAAPVAGEDATSACVGKRAVLDFLVEKTKGQRQLSFEQAFEQQKVRAELAECLLEAQHKNWIAPLDEARALSDRFYPQALACESVQYPNSPACSAEAYRVRCTRSVANAGFDAAKAAGFEQSVLRDAILGPLLWKVAQARSALVECGMPIEQAEALERMVAEVPEPTLVAPPQPRVPVAPKPKQFPAKPTSQQQSSKR